MAYANGSLLGRANVLRFAVRFCIIEGMKDKKTAATFRLSETALALLVKLAEKGGTTRTAILEALIRAEAKREKIARE